MVAWNPDQPNLVGNPSFEGDILGWGSLSTGLERVAGGFDGGSALQMTGGATTGSFGCQDSPNWVTSIPKHGTRYRCTAWVRSNGNLGSARIQLREYLGTLRIGTANSPEVVLSSAWQRLMVEYVSAATGSSCGGTSTASPARAPHPRTRRP